MSIIDLLITKKNEEFKLSDLGLDVRDIDDSSPSLDINHRVVTNRSGRTRTSGRYGVKSIKVVGNFYTDSLFNYEELKDALNEKIVSRESYFITKMLPRVEGLYDFELPGEASDDINTLEMEHEPYKYRYNVILVNYTTRFISRSQRGLLFDFEINFETDGLPFGETKSRNITVTNNITYNGTAKNSQLESPWYVKLTASEEQKGDFYLTINGRKFEHTSKTKIENNDVFELRGVETRLNHSNINEYTNYEHFILNKGTNKIETDFIGTIEIIGLKDFYK